MASNKKYENQMDEKKKAFIQEQIVPERNNRIKKDLMKLAAVAFCAVLFGTVASFTFHLTGDYFDEIVEEKNDETVSLEEEEQQENTEETTSKPEEADQEKPVKHQQETVVMEKELTLDNIEEAYALLRKTVREYNRCIVTVSGVVQGVDWFDNPSKIEEAAYGVILAEDEKRFYILTARDKVEGVESIRITFSDTTAVEGKLRGKDKRTNLAVLSVAKEQLSKDTLEKIFVVPLGDSYSLSEGNFVMALGSPDGSMYSIDYGIISGQKRGQAVTDGKLELFPTNMAYHAAGEGIIVDINGRIVGLISHDYNKDSNADVSTMIGISRLKTIIEKMINKQEMPYFGIIANDIPEEYQEELGVENGIYITDVEGNSPALETGLRAGDVIVEANGTMVSSIINFSNILAQCVPEMEMPIKIVRNVAGEAAEQELTVVLGTR